MPTEEHEAGNDKGMHMSADCRTASGGLPAPDGFEGGLTNEKRQKSGQKR